MGGTRPWPQHLSAPPAKPYGLHHATQSAKPTSLESLRETLKNWPEGHSASIRSASHWSSEIIDRRGTEWQASAIDTPPPRTVA
jgi:hypothetical protein